MSKLKEMREKRAQVHADVTKLLQGAQTAETRSRVDAMLSEVETLGNDIARIERADKLAHIETAEINQPTGDDKAYRSVWAEYMQRGVTPKYDKRALSGDKAAALVAESRARFEQRDQEAGTQSISYTQGTAGGYFVPAGFVQDVDKATAYFAPLLDGTVVRVMETASGQPLPYPKSNDTDQAWNVLGEAVQIQQNSTGSGTRRANYSSQGVAAPSGAAGDIQVSNVVFGAWKGSTGLIRVSLELLQDSAFSVEAFLKEAFAVRMGRGYEWFLTQGTGSSQPVGLIPGIQASSAVPVVAAGSSTNDGGSSTGANSIGYADIVSLIHSVDPSYRRGAKFMMHDQTLAHLKTRLDKYGRPLWVPSVREGEPDRLAGFEYVINQSMPQLAASATTMIFGDFSKFIVRKVKDLQVLRLDERFADYGQVAYVAFSRIDSQLVDGSGKALNTLVQHS